MRKWIGRQLILWGVTLLFPENRNPIYINRTFDKLEIGEIDYYGGLIRDLRDLQRKSPYRD
jgi:hypothetical protein